jgi:hypothetical protein
LILEEIRKTKDWLLSVLAIIKKHCSLSSHKYKKSHK